MPRALCQREKEGEQAGLGVIVPLSWDRPEKGGRKNPGALCSRHGDATGFSSCTTLKNARPTLQVDFFFSFQSGSVDPQCSGAAESFPQCGAGVNPLVVRCSFHRTDSEGCFPLNAPTAGGTSQSSGVVASLQFKLRIVTSCAFFFNLPTFVMILHK